MTNFKFVEKARLWMSISLAIIIIGLVWMAFGGLNLGVDFTGGTLMYINIGQEYNVDDVRDIVNKYADDATVSNAGEDKLDAMIRMKVDAGSSAPAVIMEDMIELYELTVDDFSVDYVGATIGKELIANAFLSIGLACVLMLLYIWIRFELQSGVAAIVALVHDVLIMLAAVAVLRVQINSAFVAAMLTIIGYSINDTIIVFDRVRENNKRYGRNMEPGQIVNKSVNETIVRSINTSVTTLFAITALYVLGVPSVKEFALPILIGVISGTYSSIFIAGPIWAIWMKKKREKRRQKIAS